MNGILNLFLFPPSFSFAKFFTVVEMALPECSAAKIHSGFCTVPAPARRGVILQSAAASPCTLPCFWQNLEWLKLTWTWSYYSQASVWDAECGNTESPALQKESVCGTRDLLFRSQVNVPGWCTVGKYERCTFSHVYFMFFFFFLFPSFGGWLPRPLKKQKSAEAALCYLRLHNTEHFFFFYLLWFRKP